MLSLLLLLIAPLVAGRESLKSQKLNGDRKYEWNEQSKHQACPQDTPWSCSTGQNRDTCCYEGTNGIFLQTQFWDYNPSIGPANEFTVHGLWPDRCSGGFNQYCNHQWALSDVTSTLQSLGLNKLVDDMDSHWLSNDGNNERLWLHEFNKHATCMSTINPNCYDAGAPRYQYAADFFKATMSLWASLPTYQWLEQAGIVPSESKSYSLEALQSALGSHVNGAQVHLGCDRNGALKEVWYYFKLQGAVATGKFASVDATARSTCPSDKVMYLPKSVTERTKKIAQA